MDLIGMKAVVTGGTRGLGQGIAEALSERGADVVVVARSAGSSSGGTGRFIAADIADRAAAERILAEHRPDILVLNAGAEPRMAPLNEISWEDFAITWDVDVKGGLFWLQAALNSPLRPGSRVLVGSSGAAVNGSPLSGGYGGAKRMLWFMTKYANGLSAQMNLGIRFQALAPLQMVAGTGVGSAGANAYAQALGLDPERFFDRFGAPMPPRLYGDHVARILTEADFDRAVALGLKGDTGITVLEEAAA
jgi:NAD(P)-dependent dehydrogenase (short-subunit alcohol dehydrogenase family)